MSSARQKSFSSNKPGRFSSLLIVSLIASLIASMLICNVGLGADQSAETSAETSTETSAEKSAEKNAEKSVANPFENGWQLDTASSNLTFQTTKNGSIQEISSFTSYAGSINENGMASIRIKLDSVESEVDLKDVRLRFLLFETYKFPEAVVTAEISPEALSSLSQESSIEVPLEFELDMHGVKQALQVQTSVTMVGDNQVSVTSVEPLSLETALFDLDAGVKKLEESAYVTIVPSGAVSFDFIFNTSTETKPNNDTEVKQAEVEAEVEGEVEGIS